ncbi:MAG: RNA polymerase sigma factor [Myxococcales bacterium]
MTPLERKNVEETIRRHFDEDRIDLAADVAIRQYQPELLSWLNGVLCDEVAAREVFSVLCEDIWKGLPAFRWESSFRTWVYQLAHNAAARRFRSPPREQPMGDDSVNHPPQDVRSRTKPWLRTDVKSEFARLRETLDAEDRMLLILRVDRQMAWQDVARIMSGPEDASLTTAALQKKASALRQRFQRVKGRLRYLAEQRGLLPDVDKN